MCWHKLVKLPGTSAMTLFFDKAHCVFDKDCCGIKRNTKAIFADCGKVDFGCIGCINSGLFRDSGKRVEGRGANYFL